MPAAKKKAAAKTKPSTKEKVKVAPKAKAKPKAKSTKAVAHEIKKVPLNQLVRSEINMRTVAPTDENADRKLKASIKAFDILQNLIVHPQGKKFGVAGGGRRLQMLNELAKEGAIAKDKPITCKVVSKEDALAATISENYHRAAPHPYDEFKAFERLANQEGMSNVQIAEEFGVSDKYVGQRLALAKVHPTLLKKFIAGQITLAAVAAFTIEPDQKKQLAASKRLASWEWQARYIRTAITKSETSLDDWRVEAVGLKAYEAAGGTTSGDLFDNDQRILDVELLEKLLQDKIAAKVEKLKADHWGWVEVIEGYFYAYEYDKLETTGKGKTLTKEQKATAGVIVEVQHGIKVHTGLVKKKAATRTKAALTGEPAEKYSQSIRDDIGHHRQQAFRTELYAKPDLCRLLLDFSIVDQTFGSPRYEHFVLVSPDARDYATALEEKHQFETSAKDLAQIYKAQNMTWKDGGIANRFKLFRALPDIDRTNLVAAAMIRSVSTSLKGQSEFVDEMIEELDIDFIDHFAPTKANMFSRVPMEVINEAIDACVIDVPPETKKMKKGELAEVAEKAWQKRPNWLPEGF